MTLTRNPFTVAIVAGGRSRRMGRDKALVELDGRPMLEHVIERVSGLGQAQTLLVSNDHAAHARFGLPMVCDSLPDAGSLGGIYTALLNSKHCHTLVVACDMPFLGPALLSHMLALREGGHDVIVPRVAGYPQGLHAVYGQACVAPIRAQIEAGRLKVIGFYDQVRVRYLDEDEWGPLDPTGQALGNVNTPEELAAAQEGKRGVR
ncbi:MAG: molybdenum cofactor guanylyltransferase [Anaerolineaceae bacterium]|nr:molybdenum cofactor guanylyltransferase [Anaerolineaceae bacterium]MDE0328059.1 molybdenum cofactor guanylyltransferase [Anaerolineaceae bacterium]